MPAKQVNLAAAAKTATKRAAAIGPTIEVRAIEKGQYGHPYARLIDRGTVFRIAVKDLTKPRAGPHPITGRQYVTVEFEGKDYGLPSWVVLSSDPIEDEDEEDFAATISGKPSKRGVPDIASDDEL